MKILLFYFFVSITCVSCATSPETLSALTSAPINTSKAELIGTRWRGKGLYNDLATVSAIDGVKVRAKINQAFLTNPGVHKLTIGYNGFDGKILPRICTAEVEMTTTLKAGKRYMIKGDLNSSIIKLWFVDASSGAIVSPVAEKQVSWVPVGTVY